MAAISRTSGQRRRVSASHTATIAGAVNCSTVAVGGVGRVDRRHISVLHRHHADQPEQDQRHSPSPRHTASTLRPCHMPKSAAARRPRTTAAWSPASRYRRRAAGTGIARRCRPRRTGGGHDGDEESNPAHARQNDGSSPACGSAGSCGRFRRSRHIWNGRNWDWAAGRWARFARVGGKVQTPNG